MSFYLNGNTIGDLYVGGTKVGEAWLNGQKVYSSAPPVINYIFRDIDANGNLTLATGALEDASEITQIGPSGMAYAFFNCTGLTGSVSFPNLTRIGKFGLQKVFYNCTGITEVHFKSSLSGNSQCTKSNMGCTSATVYFDLP